MLDKTVSDKRPIIVTGASAGIGRSVALLVGQKGYPVCVSYREDTRSAIEVVDVILKSGGQAFCHQADVSNEEAVTKLFEETDRIFGALGGLVNNAGISGGRIPLEEVTLDHFNLVLQTNLTSAFLCSKAAVQRMAVRNGGAGGSIVNVSSIAARTGGNFLAPYVASKGGVSSLTKAMAIEFANDSIRVNTVSPGIIATKQQPLDDEEWIARTNKRIPMDRIGQPEEVAHAVAWLLSDEASYITGEIVNVAGGMSS